MFPDDFYDGFILPGALLPQEEPVTLTDASGTVLATGLVARRETTGNEELMELGGLAAGANAATFTFAVAQTGYVDPRINYRIVSARTGTWVVKIIGNSVGMRLIPVTCVREQGVGQQ